MRALILVATAALALAACGDREQDIEIDYPENVVVQDPDRLPFDCDAQLDIKPCRELMDDPQADPPEDPRATS